MRTIRVYGVVQGVGFRPFVKKLADDMGLRGSVCNRGSFVEIIADMDERTRLVFVDRLWNEAPRASIIHNIETLETEGASTAYFASDGPFFEIIESKENKGERFIPADIAICDKCAAELYEKGGRRYLHPFINCTDCGPRLTVIKKLPYDRQFTSMDDFEMCSDCEREYYDVADRRYDAQPVCCNNCGPVMYAYDPEAPGEYLPGDPVTRARKVIADGGIVAVKGVGGFHLCVDATNPLAVKKLRERKHRPVKPFAVMGKNLSALKRVCNVDEKARKLLCSSARPIVILPRKSEALGGNIVEEDSGDLELGNSLPAQLCAPGNPTLGVFLPYAPVQLLLFDYPDDVQSIMPDYLVMTSGNVSGAPLAVDDEQANEMLGDICDLVLSHNRQILCRADDSVMQLDHGHITMIRRSRGYAPLPIVSKKQDDCVLAVGGELKSSFCIGKDEWYYPSAFIGEQTDIRSEVALRATIAHYIQALSIKPDRIVCDMHPDYTSSRIAEELAREYGIGYSKVQHHYAHILSCMAENREEGPVIGVALDGTGYGDDGSIWGGEMLLCDRNGYRRIGSHKPFSQVGGDASARAGWRIAVGMLLDRGDHLKAKEWALKLGLCSEEEYTAVNAMYDMAAYSIRSTSAARLFDAAAAVLGFCGESTFEGEAAMALQFAAQRACKRLCKSNVKYDDESALYDSLISDMESTGRFSLKTENGRYILPTDELFSYLTGEYAAGRDKDELALHFHAILTGLWHKALLKAREDTGVTKAALSGGCFVNGILLHILGTRLKKDGFTVLTHEMVPPNDGGLALGQAYAKIKV